jgi:hypothetical protein
MLSFDITLIGVKACLLASFYPILLYFSKKAGLFGTILTTLIFTIFSFLLASRTLFFCIFISLFLSYTRSIPRKIQLYILVILVPSFITACLINWHSILGRWFIMQNILDNIGTIPLTGFGWHSFNLHYSEWQSAYFNSQPGSDMYVMLADCPLFAFNEVLNFYVEFGIFSPILFLFLWVFIFSFLVRKESDRIRHYAITCLVILIFSLVSYPFHSLWVIFVFIVFILLIIVSLVRSRIFVFTLNVIISGIVICVSFNYYRYLDTNRKWVAAQMIPISEKSDKRAAYQELIQDLYDNPYFLKNYVNYLLADEQIKDAQGILFRFEKYFIRYDFLISLGQSFLMQNDMKKASQCYSEAHNTIPNRFIPIAFLMRIAIQEKDIFKATNYANQILLMKEKVPSNITASIKAEARDWISLQGF